MNNLNTVNIMGIHGESIVLVEDNHIVEARYLVKDDVVKLGNGLLGVIECVVKTFVFPTNERLSIINADLVVTDDHPIRLSSDNRWKYGHECNVNTNTNMYNHRLCDTVYNFVLKQDINVNHNSRGYGYGMIIGGYECATLGNGIVNEISDNITVVHPFFGTELIVDTLKRSRSYNNGLVILYENWFIRNNNIIYDINL